MSDDDSAKKAARAHARYAVDWRVTLKCPDWRFAGKVAAQNASRGGIFILTTRPPKVGSQVELTIELPDGAKLNLRGTVQHVVTQERAVMEKRGPGIGVKLADEHATDLILLEEMASNANDADPPDAPSVDIDLDMSEQEAEPEPPKKAAVSVPGPVADPPSAPVVQGSPVATAALGKIAIVGGSSVSKAIGMDFGTSYTSVSVAVGEKVVMVPDEMGRVLMPSLVSYPERGAPLVGWSARPRLAHDPRRTVPSSKRLLGKTYSDPAVGGYLASASYLTTAGPQDTILIDIEGNQVAVPQVCASIIGQGRELAEQYLKRPVKEAVMSIPVTFTEAEKSALRRAAQLGGLEVIGLIEEPVAAAMAYQIGQRLNEIVAVYDFGGGTFDFTVLDVNGERFRVLASEGDGWLGGDDFDLCLAQAVADALWRATKIELRQRVVEWQRLLLACEEAKRTLSSDPIAYIVVDGILETPKRIDLKQKIDRITFERLSRELFDRSIGVCQAALYRAGLEPSSVTQVVVTGGVSRIPFVRKGLSQFFEREITSVVNPEEAIAMGAAIRAGRLVGHTFSAASSSTRPA
jgi:Tfp pilus assembly protein PilZ